MTLRLEERTLRVDTVLGEGEVQAVVEGSVELPDSRPDIERVLRVRAVPVVHSVEALDGQIVVEGVLELSALYTAAAEAPFDMDPDADPYAADEGPLVYERLHGVEWPDALPFTQAFEVVGAHEGLSADADVAVETVESDVSSDRRTLAVDVVVAISGRVYESQTLNVATDVKSATDIVTEERQFLLQSVVGRGRGKSRAEGALALPEGTEDAEVVWAALTPEITHASVGEGEVTVRGNLRGDVIYLTGRLDEPVRLAVVDELSFETTVPVEGAAPGSERRAYVQAGVGAVKWALREEEPGSPVLKADASVRLDVRVEQNERARVVTHLASAEDDVEVAARTENINLVEVVGSADQALAAGEALEIGPEQLPIERLLAGEAKVHVDDVHVLGDRVAIEGHVEVSVVYLGRGGHGEGDAPQLASWPNGIPFEAEVAIDGAEPGMQRQVVVKLEEVTFDLRNRETVDVDVRLDARVMLSRGVDTEMVVEAVLVPPPAEESPSYTFLVLQKGDTLWKLARKYHTDEQTILAANPDLEAEADLAPGEKLCIPKARATTDLYAV